MSMSDREREILEEMERVLFSEEEKAKSTRITDTAFRKRAQTKNASYTKLIIGILVVLASVGLIIASVITKLMLLGVLAFIIMVAGAWFVLENYDRFKGKTKR